LATPIDLKTAATRDIAGAMNAILADVFALYLKTKNFHWHMSGPHFRDCHLLLDEQATQIFALTDPIVERIRKTGGSTIKWIGHIARIQRVLDNDAGYVQPLDMLAELRATASLIEIWIDEAEQCSSCSRPAAGVTPQRSEHAISGRYTNLYRTASPTAHILHQRLPLLKHSSRLLL
jgi:DNA-binding ferritin-like protein